MAPQDGNHGRYDEGIPDIRPGAIKGGDACTQGRAVRREPARPGACPPGRAKRPCLPSEGAGRGVVGAACRGIPPIHWRKGGGPDTMPFIDKQSERPARTARRPGGARIRVLCGAGLGAPGGCSGENGSFLCGRLTRPGGAHILSSMKTPNGCHVGAFRSLPEAFRARASRARGVPRLLRRGGLRVERRRARLTDGGRGGRIQK